MRRGTLPVPGSGRAPADLVILLLAAEQIVIRPTSLRNWTHRGHITRTAEGYDLREIVNYLDRRAGMTRRN